MASNAAIQQYVNDSADPALSIYSSGTQNVPIATGNTSVFITNVNEYIVNNISSPGEPAGNTTELQFNTNGRMDGDEGLTYNPTTDSLTVLGNLTAGYVLTNNLKYANGTSWSFSSTSYSNANVGAYLPTYVGNLNANAVTATMFQGSGANLTNIPASNIVGTITATTATTAATVTTNAQPNITSVGTLSGLTVSSTISGNISGSAGSATTATTAGTVTSAAQGNITSVGTLTSLSVTNKVTAGQLQGEGGNISNVTAANITGTVANASHAIVSNSANSIAGANVSGTVGSATNSTNATFAGTVTTNAQPNITSVGTLNGLTSSGIVNLSSASNVSLGPMGNVKITGGSNGQVLSATSTDGVLQWSTPTVGTLQDVTSNPSGNTTDKAISITNSTVSTSFNNGALKVTGGVGIGGDVHINGQIAANGTVYAGHLADFGTWVNPVIVGRDTGSDYIQGALVNINPNGSADWVAYNDTSDEDGGASAWTDMGYTGSTFNDPLYTITQANDGYLFVQGKVGASGGNLVLATGERGAHKDLVFATGGFLSNNESMRLDHERDIFFIGGHAHVGLSDRVIDVDINGNVIIGGDTTVSGNIIPSANVTYNLGNSTHRFNDLYLAGTTIDLGGTLIQAQANGEVSIGNATFSSSGTISAADISIGITELTANTTAILGHVGSMLTYSNVSNGITYDIPNNATTAFAIGSRIELLALSQSTIIVEPAAGSGVTLITSKDLNVNNPTISNIQSAKLTKIGTDTWYLGL